MFQIALSSLLESSHWIGFVFVFRGHLFSPENANNFLPQMLAFFWEFRLIHRADFPKEIPKKKAEAVTYFHRELQRQNIT